MLSYKGLATLLFGGVVDKYPDFFSSVKDDLTKANIKIPFRSYVGMIFLTSSIVYFVSLFALIFALNFFVVSFLMKIIFLLFIPFLISVVCFVILVFYPYQKMLGRGKDIETNLPFLLMHMGAIAASGAPPQGIFRLMSEFEEYGEVSYEMKKIVRNIDVFGIDPLTSIRQVAEKSPSKSLKQVLFGFITTTESGGDIRSYLKNTGQQALFEWRIKRERFLQQLSAYAEFYTGLLIAAPLFIIALFAIMNMISPTMGGFNILDLMKISIYIIVPVLNIVFLIFLRGVEVEI